MKSAWSIRILNVYGLNQVEYESFRNRLKLVNSQVEAQPILQELTIRVTAQQAQNLQQQIFRLLSQPSAPVFVSNNSLNTEIDDLSTNFAGMGMTPVTTGSTSTSIPHTTTLPHLNATNLIIPLMPESSKIASSLPMASSTKAPPVGTVTSEPVSHSAPVSATVSTAPPDLTVEKSASYSALPLSSTSASLLNQLGVSVRSMSANSISALKNSLSSTSSASLSLSVVPPSLEHNLRFANRSTADLVLSSNESIIKPSGPS